RASVGRRASRYAAPPAAARRKPGMSMAGFASTDVSTERATLTRPDRPSANTSAENLIATPPSIRFDVSASLQITVKVPSAFTCPDRDVAAQAWRSFEGEGVPSPAPHNRGTLFRRA